MRRFGIDLGFGERNIGEVCRQNGIDVHTFLTVVNFLTETEAIPVGDLLNSVLFDIFAAEKDLASHNCVEDYIFVPASLSLEKQ